ncbi:hypothetical protein PVAP13_2NG473303 [Panicum virgatum]|uniref:DUF4220 domain-containing protein n=1 Tax=Panicum virgatum TaxID=38727 RepID=A0A8T0VZR8_PANVG|nr:hypothetical protein PVAP13_2NG473303 [Panicum virgatum]
MKKHDNSREPVRILVRKLVSLVVRIPEYRNIYLIGLYAMDPLGAASSRGIITLVRRHLEAGWEKHIDSAATYREFNDRRGGMALEHHECDDSGLLRSSLRVPFAESVLLWHIATDLCFYHHHDVPGPGAWRTASRHHQKAARCREMSNYMVHLLCENPQMLMVGARRHLFNDAYEELCKIFGNETSTPKDEKELAQRIIAKGDSRQGEGEGGGFVHDARALAEALLALGDDAMWEAIEGVWVEMLCFSAGRCRGYLHAKALGTGGEFLNYVWLLMSYMGMETLAERMQRAELPGAGGDAGAARTADEIVIIEGVV